LGKTPAEAGSASAASLLSSLYDQELSAGLTVLGVADHLDIHVLNSFALIDAAVADPAAYGLKNVTTPVWTGNYTSDKSGTLHATGAAQNSYLFFDQLHPTETGHLALAGLALAAVG
jgi:outer membrane lipase/esterase